MLLVEALRRINGDVALGSKGQEGDGGSALR